LKFACETLPLPTYDMLVTTMLVPEDMPPLLTEVPVQTAELTAPPEIGPPTRDTPPGTVDTGYPGFPPIFVPPGGGGDVPIIPVVTPPGGGGDTPPGEGGGVIPEPSTFVLLGTGMAAMWAGRKRIRK
jgi:hypothetical protein